MGNLASLALALKPLNLSLDFVESSGFESILTSPLVGVTYKNMALDTLRDMTEKQPYSVLKRYPELELRQYPTGMQIETLVSGDFNNAGSLGFRPLVRFISGNNRSGQAIAMTAPVIQESIATGKHKIRFVMPEEMDESTTPAPADSDVSVVAVPAHLAAARKFGGSWNNEKFQKEGDRLLEEVGKAGLVPEGNLYWSRFDPPWKPGFLKHNEVLIRVKKSGSKIGD